MASGKMKSELIENENTLKASCFGIVGEVKGEVNGEGSVCFLEKKGETLVKSLWRRTPD